MNEFEGKKLLILGGASVHCKLVRAAKEMGVYTVVTDYLKPEASPAKQIADKSCEINIFDVDEVVKMGKREKVDAVLGCFIDPCQRPYQQICEKLNLPCYGTKEQFFQYTDKHAFKKLCNENGVDTIPEYSVDELYSRQIEFPVYVKPVDSRGSRGQSVCYTMMELERAIEKAKSESSNSDVLIEKYMKGAHEFQVTYFVLNGEPNVIRLSDCYTGSEKNHLEKVTLCSVTPSKFLDLYMANAHPNIVKMIKNSGIKNGPVFMQGFEDHGVFRLFDPGLRFPGADFELIFKEVFHCDLMKVMIILALTGECGCVELPAKGAELAGKRAALLFPTVKAGQIKAMHGVDAILEDEHIISYLPRYYVGDYVEWSYNVNQRFNEINVLADNTEQLISKLRWIKTKLKVVDTADSDMFYEWPDFDLIE